MNPSGLRTLIASMASLTFCWAMLIGRVGAKMRYLKVFTLVNVVFLVALLGLACYLAYSRPANQRLPSWIRACWRQPRFDHHFG